MKQISRKKLVVGNWKMHKSLFQGREDFAAFEGMVKERAKVDTGFPHVGLAVPALMLPSISQTARFAKLYAQNVHWAASGAFTGETPVSHLAELGAQGSVVAHSERRQMNGETNSTAGLRMNALLGAGLECILCVGETLEQREAGELKKVLREQIFSALVPLAANAPRLLSPLALGSDAGRPLLSIAYEPVWAIGTGKAATPVEAQEAHLYIRGLLNEILGQENANLLRLLYGGSVNLKNAREFFACPDVDGALVGGASLNPVDFFQLCEKATGK